MFRPVCADPEGHSLREALGTCGAELGMGTLGRVQHSLQGPDAPGRPRAR